MYEMTLIPAATTDAKRKVVTPPRTGLGMERNTPETLPRTGSQLDLTIRHSKDSPP
jgi:hypothetical protein